MTFWVNVSRMILQFSKLNTDPFQMVLNLIQNLLLMTAWKDFSKLMRRVVVWAFSLFFLAKIQVTFTYLMHMWYFSNPKVITVTILSFGKLFRTFLGQNFEKICSVHKLVLQHNKNGWYFRKWVEIIKKINRKTMIH